MGISAELISIAFGVAGVAIALATYWTTRKRNTTISEPDSELGLLDTTCSPVSPRPSIEEVNNTTAITTAMPHATSKHNNQSNELIGATLELFSRHLRDHT